MVNSKFCNFELSMNELNLFTKDLIHHGILIVQRDFNGEHTVLTKKLIIPIYAIAFTLIPISIWTLYDFIKSPNEFWKGCKKYIDSLTSTIMNGVLWDITLGRHAKLNFKDDKLNKYFVYVNTKYSGINIIITDENYPSRIALEPGQHLHDLYNIHKSKIDLHRVIQKYNKPEDIDELYKSKVEITNIKDIMMDNIDKLIERDVHLDTILDKANDLDDKTFEFYKATKNKCCIIFEFFV